MGSVLRLQMAKSVGTLLDVTPISPDAVLLICEEASYIVTTAIESGKLDRMQIKPLDQAVNSACFFNATTCLVSNQDTL